MVNTISKEPFRSESPLIETVFPLMVVDVVRSPAFAVTWPEVATNGPRLVLPVKVVGVATSTAIGLVVGTAKVNAPSSLRVALLGEAVSVETNDVPGE